MRHELPDQLDIAACFNRVELVRMLLRPNLADVGWPPVPPPRDDPQDVLDELSGSVSKS